MDERLRDLERRARESGDPRLEARWLAERVRTGDLDVGRLQVAQALGHPASLLVGQPTSTDWLDALLDPAWAEAGRRAALALAQAAWTEAAGTSVHAPLGGVLRRVEAWLDCPCRPCGEDVEDQVTLAYHQAEAYVWSTSWSVAWSEPRVAPAPQGADLVRDFYDQEHEAAQQSAQDGAWNVVLGLARVATLTDDPVRADLAPHALGEVLRLGVEACGGDDAARATIRPAVVPWLLR